MHRVTNLNEWFFDRLYGIDCSDDAIAYASRVLSHYAVSAVDDMSDRSLVVAFLDAKQQSEFVPYQKLADWILYVCCVHPTSVSSVMPIALDIGRLSYGTCYRLVKRSWPVYEELSIDLSTIASSVHERLHSDAVNFDT